MTATIVPDYTAAEALITANASANAYPLTELAGILDSDLHYLVLDPDTRTLWYAWDNTPLDSDNWSVEELSPEQAIDMLEGYIDTVQDRMDDPESYVYGGDLDTDQATLDEYTQILRLSLPADPSTAVGHIRHRRALIARQDALWQRTYAELVRDLAGTEHGGKTRAGRVLGVTDVQVGRIIREDDQRRERLAQTVRELRDATPKD